MLDSLEKIAANRWGQGATIDWFLPSRASSPQARQMFARFERMAVSPSAFLRVIRMVREIDVRAVLSAIHVPTLVIQRLDDIMTPPCHGRYLASQIPGARYIEQPGTTLCDSLEAGTATGCSTRSRTSSPVHRVAAILIACSPRSCSPKTVDSTAHADKAGDRPQVGHLDAHSAAISQRVRSHRGRLRESTAQRILATFDTPGQAIRSAAAIRDGASAHGIQLRAGIHTGEVDLVGDEIGGISVDIVRCVTA